MHEVALTAQIVRQFEASPEGICRTRPGAVRELRASNGEYRGSRAPHCCCPCIAGRVGNSRHLPGSRPTDGLVSERRGLSPQRQGDEQLRRRSQLRRRHDGRIDRPGSRRVRLRPADGRGGLGRVHDHRRVLRPYRRGRGRSRQREPERHAGNAPAHRHDDRRDRPACRRPPRVASVGTTATGTPWTAAGGDFSPTVLASITADPAASANRTVLTFTGSGTSNPLVQAAQAALDNPTSGVFEFLIKFPSGTSAGQEQGTSPRAVHLPQRRQPEQRRQLRPVGFPHHASYATQPVAGARVAGILSQRSPVGCCMPPAPPIAKRPRDTRRYSQSPLPRIACRLFRCAVDPLASSFSIPPPAGILRRLMLILLTNDDGITAAGLVAMYRELLTLRGPDGTPAEVHVVAPATVQIARRARHHARGPAADQPGDGRGAVHRRRGRRPPGGLREGRGRPHPPPPAGPRRQWDEHGGQRRDQRHLQRHRRGGDRGGVPRAAEHRGLALPAEGRPHRLPARPASPARPSSSASPPA